jgi:hypothetical protein
MIYVFVGPTLSAQRVEQVLAGTPVRVLPPAGQGDVYRAARRRPDALVIIDGYFHQVAAVWHKEILWALQEGVPVFGAASMGALRAAELEAFGMVGVGVIFEAYRDGVLISDDEVTVAHGDESTGYRAMSEPLVNIRATLDNALAQDVISPSTHGAAFSAAANLYYVDRLYSNVMASLGDHREVAALSAWLPTGRVDQKALDADAVLRCAARTLALPKVSWLFERTSLWEEMVRVQGTRSLDQHEVTDDELIEELKSDADAYRHVAVAALARLLAADAARSHGRALQVDELIGELDRIRHALNLHEVVGLKRWMADNDLSVQGLSRLLAGEVHLGWAIKALSADLEPFLLDQLRLMGTYRKEKQLAE